MVYSIIHVPGHVRGKRLATFRRLAGDLATASGDFPADAWILREDSGPEAAHVPSRGDEKNHEVANARIRIRIFWFHEWKRQEIT